MGTKRLRLLTISSVAVIAGILLAFYVGPVWLRWTGWGSFFAGGGIMIAILLAGLVDYVRRT